jgi:hypothetical protein
MMEHPHARACFLAGTVEDQGASGTDDDGLHGKHLNDKESHVVADKDGNREKIKRANYQCIDCLLLIPGVSHWGCSVPALKTWCSIASENIMDRSASDDTDKAKHASAAIKEMSKHKAAEDLQGFEDNHHDIGQLSILTKFILDSL